MFTRPHYRDWMPLLTQQLRLRNVIKIIGRNIERSTDNLLTQCRIYYTLHHNLNEDPIYSSELITLLGNGNANWAEIDCDLIHRTPCSSICIKVWQKSYKENSLMHVNIENEEQNIENNQDQLLFVWGVHFSGLILVSKQLKRTNKFKPNTLLFKINGSYFTSSNKIIIKIKEDNINETKLDNNINNSKQSIHDSGTNSLENKNIFKSESTYGGDDSLLAKSCDTRHSTENLSKVLLPNLSSSLGEQSTHHFISPGTLLDKKEFTNLSIGNIETSNNVEKLIDIRINMSKKRYSSYNIKLHECRPSYNLEKLLETQKQQRKFKLCLKDIHEISEHICLRSAECINTDLLANIKPGAIYHNYNKSKNAHSMGRTLNKLLFQEVEIKPEEVLKAQELKKQIENQRFRLKILKEEKLRLINNNKQLEKKMSEISDQNVEMGSWLMSRYRNLSKEKELLVKEHLDVMNKTENLMKMQIMLRQVTTQFCSELKEIFEIERKTVNKYTICKIYLPNSDELTLTGQSQDSIFVVVPISLSTALGYVAHVVQMCSILLNIPLRNPIKCEGSRSKIIDNIKDIPNSSREFPLYTRSCPPPKSVLYAIYLLNQNIGQLTIESNRNEICNPRATLQNLLQLLNGPNIIGNLLQLSNLDQDNENTFKHSTSTTSSSTNLNFVSIPSGIAGKSDNIDYIISNSSKISGNDQRISRSFGSYSDDNYSTASDKSFYNSEPILTTHSITVSLENSTKNENF